MYKLRISSKAKKEIKKMPFRHQKALILAFAEIKDEPFLGKPLKRELTGKFSFRVGAYRIIDTINQKENVIAILTAGHRATIYN
jgi:mRNA interferase RelE/StbE